MKKLIVLVAIAALVALVLPSAVAAGPPVRVIVRFEGGVVDRAALSAIEKLGGAKVKELPLVGGVVVVLPGPAAERAAAKVRGVRSIEPDLIVTALAGRGGSPKPPPAPPAQEVQWGIERIGADDVWATNTGDPIKVAVVDTGIDVTHPDLVANLKGGWSAVGYTTSWNDDNGHGTHVAGIIAAANNTIGVVGVGPDIDLYAVKVLNKKGSGFVSDIVEGLTWCMDNDIDVVNMSLGASQSSDSFAEAVQKALDAGIVVVAAAGNSGPKANTVDYPGAYPGVIAVGAIDSADGIASWSSRGPQVGVCAPGVSILSTVKGSAYATYSGTSMASPHVAGVAALVLASGTPGAYDVDGDGAWDPSEVRAKLIATADDLGTTGFDTSFGNGIVNAVEAVAH